MLFAVDDIPFYRPPSSQEGGSLGCLQEPSAATRGTPISDRAILAIGCGWNYTANCSFCPYFGPVYSRWWRENSMADRKGHCTTCRRGSLHSGLGCLGDEVQASNGSLQGEISFIQRLDENLIFSLAFERSRCVGCPLDCGYGQHVSVQQCPEYSGSQLTFLFFYSLVSPG